MGIKEHIIFFQKEAGGSPLLSSLADFGCVCTLFPFLPFGEVKELSVQDWADTDGDDVFVPEVLRLAAYDLEVEMAYKGEPYNAWTDFMKLGRYLTGRDGTGAAMKIYNPFTRCGRRGVYLSSLSDVEYHNDGDQDVATFKMALRVSDPMTEIVPDRDPDDPDKILGLVNL